MARCCPRTIVGSLFYLNLVVAAGTAFGQSGLPGQGGGPVGSGGPGAPRDPWYDDGDRFITIHTPNYSAYCDKATGLCDFYGPTGELLLPEAGETWIEGWDGIRQFDSYHETGRHADDLWIRRSQFPVTNYAVTDEGTALTVAFTHVDPGEVQFDTLYRFAPVDPLAEISSSITYLADKNVIHETISLGLPNDYTETAIDDFEPAVLGGDTQHDALDAVTNWAISGNASAGLSTDPAYVHEGTGSMAVTFYDNGNQQTDNATGVYSVFPRVTYAGATTLTFWLMPLQQMRLNVTLYSDAGSATTTSTWFPPNEWSLFEWDFGRENGFTADRLWRMDIYSPDNGFGFTGPSATAFFDDIRFAQAVQGGLLTSTRAGSAVDYWAVPQGTLWLDQSRHDAGTAALRWANVNLSNTLRSINQFTLAGSPRADPRLPTDLSAYDYLLVDVYVDSPLQVASNLYVHDGSHSRYSLNYYIPPQRWMTLAWPFKRADTFTEPSGTCNLAHIAYYGLRFYVNGPANNVTIWLDNLRLRQWTGEHVVFDGEKGALASDGVAVKYSSRVCRVGSSTYVYGDSFGAGGIEKMEKNDGLLDAYIYDGDMHTFRSTVDRQGIENPAGLTFYKELARTAGEQAHAQITLAFDGTSRPQITKGRWPRAHEAAYTISEDDFFYSPQKAFFCGTSDTTSPGYGRSGLVGHHLRVSDNLWYYLSPEDGGGTAFDNPDVKAFLDYLHAHGVEIAIHSPGLCEDTRTAAAPALDALVGTYGTRMWVDHASGCNPEDFVRTGAFRVVGGQPNDGDTGYYMLDLVRQRGFRYIWPITNPLYYTNTSNLFCKDYKEVCPLPYTSRMISPESPDQAVYLFGRGKGNGLPDFLVPGGGGNIPELMQVVAQRGLVIVYTHSHIGWSWVGSGGVATLNSAAESVFAALEAMQDSGTLWVDTASNILDWMLANENVSIDAQTGSTVIVTNRNGSQMRGVTLESPDLGISAARIGDRYQIYSTANRVVLPELGPMESATVELLMGPIDPLFPRLNYVAPHTDVLRAEYDPDSRGLLLWIRGSGNEDPRARALSLTYRESGFFTLFDNGAPFAVIFNGNVSPVDPQYETSYEYSNGALSFVLPDPQDFHEIMLEFQDYPCPHDGDINHDGVTDLKDLPGFVAVLLGEESLPCTAIAADLDGSGTADGDDIAPFIQRLLAP